MLIYHGSGETVSEPEIRKTGYPKDFSWGFYCTNIERQAERWAKRHGAHGVVNIYEYTPKSLCVKQFPEMDNEWLDFVVQCRLGGTHSYDIVEGPMADDTIFNYVQSFVDGEISRAAFWELVKFRYPTHQISFHTDAALKCLCFQRGYQIG